MRECKSPLKEVKVDADVSVEITLAAYVEHWTTDQWMPLEDHFISERKNRNNDNFGVTLTVKKSDLHN